MATERAQTLALATEILGLIGAHAPDGSWLTKEDDAERLVTYLALYLAKQNGIAALPAPIREHLTRFLGDLGEPEALADWIKEHPLSPELSAGIARAVREAQLSKASGPNRTGVARAPRQGKKPEGKFNGPLSRFKLGDWE